MFYMKKFDLEMSIRKFLTWKCFTQVLRDTSIGRKSFTWKSLTQKCQLENFSPENVLHEVLARPWSVEHFLMKNFILEILIRKFLTWKCFTQGSRETLIGWKDSGGWSEFKERRAHKRMKKCCIPIFFNKYWFAPIFISWIYLARFWIFGNGN